MLHSDAPVDRNDLVVDQPPENPPVYPYQNLPEANPYIQHPPNAFPAVPIANFAPHPVQLAHPGAGIMHFQPPAPPAPVLELGVQLGLVENAKPRPNTEVHPGVYRIPVHIHCSNNDLCIFTVDSDISWDDFYSRLTAHFNEADAPDLVLKHSKMAAGACFWASNFVEWGTFMHMVVGHAQTAIKKAIKIQVIGQKPVAIARGNTSKKRTRLDNIPSESKLNKELGLTPESAPIFLKIKTCLTCKYHSGFGNNIYCIICKPTNHPDLHQEVSLKFIGIWATKCLSGNATEDHPPNCLPLNPLPKKRGKTGNNHDVHVTIHHAVASADCPIEALPHASGVLGPGLVSSSSSTQEQTPCPPGAESKDDCDFFIEFPEIAKALAGLHTTKPAHGFLDLVDAFHSAGYKYVDELQGVTPAELSAKVGAREPVACQVIAYANMLANQAREESKYVYH